MTNTVSISINETTTISDLNDIISIFAEATGKRHFNIATI